MNRNMIFFTFQCAVTHDVLNNATPVAVLKPTGDVVTVECVEKIIKKDMIHPLTGQSLKEKDIITIQMRKLNGFVKNRYIMRFEMFLVLLICHFNLTSTDIL